MNGGAQGGFGRTALSDSFQNALYIAHSIGLDNVLNSGKRFRVVA
jgi:hypothetical protein